MQNENKNTIYLIPKNKGEALVFDNLTIILPKKPKKKDILYHDLPKKEQRWNRLAEPKGLNRDTASNYVDYIEEEFRRRIEGLWFYNNGVPTYITGSHYMFIQWSKIDVGYPDYRAANRTFFIFWEACKLDPNSYGMCFLKNRRSGFSYMASSETVNLATQSYESRFGILSKSGSDAKVMFTDKVVRIYRNYPFFFQPIMDGSSNPRVELAFREPSKKITKNQKHIESSEALNSSIDWKNTGDNSYDGEKLRLLVQDEAGKWTGQNSIKKNWGVTRTCLLLGRRIVGKCMMGSTANKLEDGGAEFKDIFYDSDCGEKDLNGRTPSGLYKLFIPAYDNLEGFIDEYGNSVIETPEVPIMGVDGMDVDLGAKNFLENRRIALKNDTGALSEFKRQFPFTVEEAFRNDSQSCIFDVEKIYQQIDFNEVNDVNVTRGEFVWKNGVRDSEVVWLPHRKGKWLVSWIPELEHQNVIGNRYNKKFPGRSDALVAGCDPYDHDTTTDGRRSDAAAHILHKFSMSSDASMQFVCEYINRPPKAEIFYEDMIKMCVFYSCQILVENNKVGILKYFENRGYYEYLMDRPDMTHTEWSKGKQKTKGIPGSGAAVINAQAEALATYIYDYVGLNLETGEMGRCYFNTLLDDWSRFDITNRTKYDASISSSLALLASQKYVKPKKEVQAYSPFVRKYSNKGMFSKKIRR
tara:strand:- start:4822 stop:6906 length:2085 start_codon:yes stop_codon:yes gene_type:complete